MALSLKLTGIATNLVMAVAVDDDNATIKEFVSSDANANMTLDSGVAASVAASSWKGNTRYGWSSTANTSSDYNGVRFASGHRPTLAMSNANGWTIFEAWTAMGAPGFSGGLVSWSPLSDAGSGGTVANGSVAGKLGLNFSSGNRGSGSTTLPTGTTKFSGAATYKADGSTGAAFFFGLESGNLAADGTSTAGIGFEPGTSQVFGIGGFSGQGECPATRLFTGLFNKVLTLAELQSLHGNGSDDWFSTLFQASAGGSFGRTYYDALLNRRSLS